MTVSQLVALLSRLPPSTVVLVPDSGGPDGEVRKLVYKEGGRGAGQYQVALYPG